MVLTAAASLTCGGEPAGPDPNAVATVVITPAGGNVDTGDSLHLSAVTRNSAGSDLSGKTIAWSTLDPTLVTVSGTGVVRGRWPGLARVIATSEGKADTANVQVAPRITSIDLIPALDTLRSLGDQVALSVVAYIDTQQYAGGTYTWERSDTSFIFLFANNPAPGSATAFARKNGSTFVRVREARGASDSAQVVVRQRVTQFFTTSPVSQAYRGCPLSSVVIPRDARGNFVPDAVVSWTSTDTTIARVDANGLITPLAVGTDTIIASADGASYRQPVSVTAAPAMVLQLLSAGGVFVTTVGRTQYVNGYGALGGGTATTAPATFHIGSSDTTIVAVTPADTALPVNSVYSPYFKVAGRSQGSATLTPYLCDVAGAPVTFTVTRPQFGIGGVLPAVARIDDGPGSLFIFVQDTTGQRHYPAEPLTVRITSTDTTVMTSDPTSRHLAGLNSAYFVLARYVEPGLARLRVEDSAGVYPSDSTPLVQVVYPPLYFAGADTVHIGMRQHAFPAWDPTYVYVDRIVAGTPLPVSMASSDTSIARVVPDSVNVPVNNTGVAIDLASGDTRGIATITARASRHRDTTAVIVVGRPAVQLSQIGGLFYPGDPPGLIHLIAADSATGVPRVVSESVTFNVATSDTAVIALDSTALTIPAGQVESPHSAAFSFKAPGTAVITANDPRATPYAYAPGTSFSVTVLEPKLVAEPLVSLGIDQQWGFSVTVEGVLRQGDVVVHLADRSPSVATLLDSTLTLTPRLNYAGLGVNGLAAGTDSVIVTAPGWVPDTGLIVVGQGSTDLQVWPPVYGLSVGQGAPLYLLMLAPNGESRVSAVTKQFTLAPNANLEFTDPFGVPITTVTVTAGQQASPQFWVRGLAAGTGTVTISAPNYTPVTKSVTVAP